MSFKFVVNILLQWRCLGKFFSFIKMISNVMFISLVLIVILSVSIPTKLSILKIYHLIRLRFERSEHKKSPCVKWQTGPNQPKSQILFQKKGANRRTILNGRFCSIGWWHFGAAAATCTEDSWREHLQFESSATFVIKKMPTVKWRVSMRVYNMDNQLFPNNSYSK